MKLVFLEQGWEDYLYLQGIDRKLLVRVKGLIRDCLRIPFAETGKLKPLRGALAGWWSRRITREHRLVYRLTEDSLFVAQCRHHY